MSLKVLALSCFLLCVSSRSEVIERCDFPPVHHHPRVVEKKVVILDHHNPRSYHTYGHEHLGRAFSSPLIDTFLLKDRHHHNLGHYHHGVHRINECLEIPYKKVIDVNVAVKKEGSHKIAHLHHHKFHPAEYIVKSPSLTLKEREAVYVGGERERQHVILPHHCNAIVKEVDPCNSCFYP